MNEVIMVGDDQALHADNDLMKHLGCDKDRWEQNEEYFRWGGDFWIDSDKVIYDGIELRWNWKPPYALLDFDPFEYPDHAQVIQLWASGQRDHFEYDMCDNTWPKFYNAKAAIAYRGGQGYSYGIHVFKESKEL